MLLNKSVVLPSIYPSFSHLLLMNSFPLKYFVTDVVTTNTAAVDVVDVVVFDVQWQIVHA